MKNLSINRNIQRTSRFLKDLKKLDSIIQIEAYNVSIKLSENIFHPELNIKKLTGFENTYRVVVLKDNRLIYSFDKENIYLLKISHRKDIYKKFEI